MGDLLQDHNIFKKLGFDISNQWIMDLKTFQCLFIWIAENITDCNVLSDIEILEENELRNKNMFLQSDELITRLELIKQEYPSILNYKNDDIIKIENNIRANKILLHKFESINMKMEELQANLNLEVYNIETDIFKLEIEEKSLFKICMEDAKEIQNLERKSKKLCSEVNDCFTKLHEPPLFTHQLPMGQYILKCESFKQYLTIYLQENFKFQDYLVNELADEEYTTKDNVLGKIKKQIIHYNRKYIQNKTESMAIKYLTDELDPKKVQVISIKELRREANELKSINLRSNYEITYKTLMNELNIHLDQIGQQQIERILYENTKLKFERATQRIKKVEFLSKIVSDALLNTELIWILMQLDLEKIKNRFNNKEQFQFETQQCMRRIEFMKHAQYQSTNESNDIYCEHLMELFENHLETSINSDKNSIFEYFKFNKLFDEMKKNLEFKKNYKSIIKLENELKTNESHLIPYIYNGPVKRPYFENIAFVKHIFESNIMQRTIEDKIRQLRTDVQENINKRMINDSLWRNSQLLWVWFLTEPRKMLTAIEEVKKAAAKVPPITGFKSLGGIRRM